MSASAAAVTPERIMQFTWGFVPTLVLESAIKHRVFDVLDGGPKTLHETAAATGASERGLRSIMNVLVGLNFLAKDDGGKYSLTPESAAFLVSTKPSFQGAILKHASGQLVPKWLQLNDVVATGKPASSVNQEGEGSEFFQQFVMDIFPMSYPSARCCRSTSRSATPASRCACSISPRAPACGALHSRRAPRGSP